MDTRLDVDLAGRSYPILIGEGVLERLGEILGSLSPTSVHVVTDATVDALHGEHTRALAAGVAPTRATVLPGGEERKTLATVATVLDGLAEAGADRHTVLLALGGGVVGDIAGFAAAIYMRGIRFVQVPTTLLAQVDSAVGGKTGVNHATGKNLIGAFHQPVAVLSDTALLRTLPARELSAGLAEVLKHGLLADAEDFAANADALPRLRAGDPAALGRAIRRSCEIKAAVVGRDERESGERALLNLGHTFAHAIETLSGYGRWLHGEAVGCGLVLAAELSRRLGHLDAAAVERVADAVRRAGLPDRIEGLPADAAIAAMRGDKKAVGGRIRFVLLERIGRAVLGEAPDALLREVLAAGGYR